jgi:hypothetical protein
LTATRPPLIIPVIEHSPRNHLVQKRRLAQHKFAEGWLQDSVPRTNNCETSRDNEIVRWILDVRDCLQIRTDA